VFIFPFPFDSAPLAVEVLSLGQLFPSLGVVAVRRSRRSFSGWVCVCSFGSEAEAASFSASAGSRFFGEVDTYFAFRRFGSRWRVSVPCSRPVGFLARRPVSRPRLGRFRVAG